MAKAKFKKDDRVIITAGRFEGCRGKVWEMTHALYYGDRASYRVVVTKDEAHKLHVRLDPIEESKAVLWDILYSYQMELDCPEMMMEFMKKDPAWQAQQKESGRRIVEAVMAVCGGPEPQFHVGEKVQFTRTTLVKLGVELHKYYGDNTMNVLPDILTAPRKIVSVGTDHGCTVYQLACETFGKLFYEHEIEPYVERPTQIVEKNEAVDDNTFVPVNDLTKSII